jgi:Polyketide cyclase / dehydrase and lipid transport
MRPGMAVSDSREVVIEATPDEIMDVVFDLESLTEWSSFHRKIEILERDEKGNPVQISAGGQNRGRRR